MQTLHVVSHTHWDREWYKTFQQFRLQLVHLVDNLLIILDNDPDYLHFMLDGQTSLPCEPASSPQAQLSAHPA